MSTTTKNTGRKRTDGVTRPRSRMAAPDVAKVEADDLSHQHIADRAYFMWLERGQPTGADHECWWAAEEELRRRLST